MRLRLLLGALLLLPSSTASAGEVSAFVTFPSPSERWGRGFGASLTSTWFQAVALEGEAARLRGENNEDVTTTFSASAMLAPPIGFLTPYAGVGVGVFRQEAGPLSDNGTFKTFIIGAKAKFGLLVVHGDYRTVDLGDEALLPMDNRWSAGAGITF